VTVLAVTSALASFAKLQREAEAEEEDERAISGRRGGLSRPVVTCPVGGGVFPLVAEAAEYAVTSVRLLGVIWPSAGPMGATGG
jgi:hypothetical protein